jgi:tRNA U38,U39,U40 pseudouridine synthase TruA
MMRLISGTLVQVGLGRVRPDEMGELLAARARDEGPRVVKAPAQGLCLERCFMQDEHGPWPGAVPEAPVVASDGGEVHVQ